MTDPHASHRHGPHHHGDEGANSHSTHGSANEQQGHIGHGPPHPTAPTPHSSHTASGMSAAEHGAHDKHAGHSVEMFRSKFWLSLVLTLPTLVWGHMLQSALGYSAPSFLGASAVPAVFGTAVFFMAAGHFCRELAEKLSTAYPE